MKIWINNRQRKISLNLPEIKKKVERILNALAYPEAELSLTLVSDRTMARWNRELLGRSGPTNVIALPQRGGPFPQVQEQLLGDVIISVETTARQAAERGLAWEELFDLYLIHGILHLLGYDHEDEGPEAARMTGRTQELLFMLHPQLREELAWPN